MTTMRIKGLSTLFFRHKGQKKKGNKRYGFVDPKQQLRAHIDQLPLDKQREFVTTALQLIVQRTMTSDMIGRSSNHDSRRPHSDSPVLH